MPLQPPDVSPEIQPIEQRFRHEAAQRNDQFRTAAHDVTGLWTLGAERFMDGGGHVFGACPRALYQLVCDRLAGPEEVVVRTAGVSRPHSGAAMARPPGRLDHAR